MKLTPKQIQALMKILNAVTYQRPKKIVAKKQ